MSDGRETVNLYFLVIGAVLLAGLGFFAPWPFWTSALLVGALVAGATLIARTAGRKLTTEAVPPYSPFPPVTEPERGRQKVVQVPLPSCIEDYDFLFSATVLWSPVGESLYETKLNPEAIAVQAVVERAKRVTEQRPPERAALVQYELSGTLGRIQPDGTGKVHAMAQDVTLTLVDDDQKRLDMLATRRKEMAFWEQEKQDEQSRLRYLSENILKSPGSAVVWHLDRNGEQVEKTVSDIRQLTHLTLAAKNELPEGYGVDPPHEYSDDESTGRASPADHASVMLASAGFKDRDQLALFAAELADHFARYGKHDVADQLRERFDQPTSHPTAKEDTEAPDEQNVNAAGNSAGVSADGSRADYNGGERTSEGN